MTIATTLLGEAFLDSLCRIAGKGTRVRNRTIIATIREQVSVKRVARNSGGGVKPSFARTVQNGLGITCALTSYPSGRRLRVKSARIPRNWHDRCCLLSIVVYMPKWQACQPRKPANDEQRRQEMLFLPRTNCDRMRHRAVSPRKTTMRKSATWLSPGNKPKKNPEKQGGTLKIADFSKIRQGTQVEWAERSESHRAIPQWWDSRCSAHPTDCPRRDARCTRSST